MTIIPKDSDRTYLPLAGRARRSARAALANHRTQAFLIFTLPPVEI
jgi:hypothetical protein